MVEMILGLIGALGAIVLILELYDNICNYHIGDNVCMLYHIDKEVLVQMLVVWWILMERMMAKR